jgi:hypothetical protein
MSRRNREINIFNMSLLDILCGALGAFCFMMLTLLPYYKPTGSGDAELQQKENEIQDLLTKLDRVRQTVKDADAARELAAALPGLQQRTQELQGELNSTRAALDDLRKKHDKVCRMNDDLVKDKKDLEDDLKKTKQAKDQSESSAGELRCCLLEKRGWYWVTAYSDHLDQDLVVFLETVKDGKLVGPAFDPRVVQPGSPDLGERARTFADQEGEMNYFAVFAPSRGAQYRLYYSQYGLREGKPGGAPYRITGVLGGARQYRPLPEVQVTPERPWILLGTFVTDATGQKLDFIPATPEEREKDWQTVAERIRQGEPSGGIRRVGPIKPSGAKAQ